MSRSRSDVRDETSAGGVVFRVDDGLPLYLLIRDSYQNWGFPKGHLEAGELAEAAALREVSEETGLSDLSVRGALETIDWFFRFRGQLIHKVCHFYLMETAQATTNPQHAEGITACRWVSFDDARAAISYANARKVLGRANEMIAGPSAVKPEEPTLPPAPHRALQLGLPLDNPRRGDRS
jgi:8-oxo-dGTP pyrophosphatase MutT (NUDIX family)